MNKINYEDIDYRRQKMPDLRGRTFPPASLLQYEEKGLGNDFKMYEPKV